MCVCVCITSGCPAEVLAAGHQAAAGANLPKPAQDKVLNVHLHAGKRALIVKAVELEAAVVAIDCNVLAILIGAHSARHIEQELALARPELDKTLV